MTKIAHNDAEHIQLEAPTDLELKWTLNDRQLLSSLMNLAFRSAGNEKKEHMSMSHRL